ncbi:MAG: amidohydrolase [Betaproteobacteria bacterium]
MRRQLHRLARVMGTLAILTGAAPGAHAANADIIFFGGDILTMAGREPRYVEALAVRGGKIVLAGSRARARALAGPGTRSVNLKGRTLLPGFIDAHGHMIYFGKNLMDANLFDSRSVAEVVERMRKHAARVPEGAWIVGMGYNAASLQEGRAPTVAELDQVSDKVPVMIVDRSGHLGSGNTKLFEAAGITAETPDPEGGNFTRGSDGRSLLGPMEETALFAVRERRPPFTGKMADEVVIGSARTWASYGQTTAMECGVGLGGDDIDIIRNAIDRKLLSVDLYLCAKDSLTDRVIDAAYGVAAAYNQTPEGTSTRLLAARPDLDKRYINRVRLGGIKFWLDGSLDTAWFTTAYAHNPPGKTGEYKGFQQVPDEVIEAALDRFWPTQMQINMHANGDAANEQALRAIEKAIARHGMRDHRPVFVHGTAMRPDQIQRLRAVGGIPTFTSHSLVPGGDAVVHMWGEKWATAMSIATLWKEGIPFTLNHDAPVSPQPWVLHLVDAAVNRISRSGAVIGPSERVPPYVALLGVTRFAAYQIKEERSKGTLEAGKLADLVILDRNPLKVDPRAIKDIRVLQTIKEGRTIFRARS